MKECEPRKRCPETGSSPAPPTQPNGLGQVLHFLGLRSEVPYYLENFMPGLPTWISVTVPTLTGMVLSGGWSRARVALISI